MIIASEAASDKLTKGVLRHKVVQICIEWKIFIFDDGLLASYAQRGRSCSCYINRRE